MRCSLNQSLRADVTRLLKFETRTPDSFRIPHPSCILNHFLPEIPESFPSHHDPERICIS